MADREPEIQLVSPLTEKQREVLDLLLDHMTSKEMSRILGISPHTVDQRLNGAKAKFGVGSRSELAKAYRISKEVYDQSIYGFSHIEKSAIPLNVTAQNETEEQLVLDGPVERDESSAVYPDEDANHRLVPREFEGRNGTALRLVAMVAIAATLVLTVLGGIAMFAMLSGMMAQ